MIRDAFDALQRNVPTLLFYIGITTGYYTLKVIGETYLLNHYKVETLTGFSLTYLFISGISTAILYAAAQTFTFSKLGKDLDQPFWKIDSAKEAFTRFFALWLLLALINTTLLFSFSFTSIDDTSRAALQLVRYFWTASYIPLGATIMFYRRINKEELQASLSTFTHQLPYYFIVIFIGFFSLMLVRFMLAANLPIWARPGISIVIGYTDCFLFASTWFICRTHRDHQDEQDDDFDF